MDKLLNEVEAELSKQLTNTPSELRLLGDKNRPNSWTFLATYSDRSQNVIKVIKPNKFSQPDSDLTETDALLKINHRTDINVVKLQSTGLLKLKKNNLPYLIFPFIKGDDLDTVLRKNKFTEKEVEKFINENTKTILQLNEEGIVHQDIKPGNIKIDAENNYKILDLGIARFIDSGYRINKQQGPAKYLSPEEINLGLENSPPNQRKITFLSDLYSIGVIAVELLIGKDFSNIWKNDEKHLASNRIRKGEIVKISDPELKETIANYLEISPSTRLIGLNSNNQHNLESIKDGKPGLATFWLLHHWSTGAEIFSRFAEENKNLKSGVIMSAEHITSLPNNIAITKRLSALGWKIAVDPATYKIPFLKDHHAKLSDKPFFRVNFNINHLYNNQFKEKFVKDTLDFQKLFNPQLFISPYFFIEDDKDDFMELNFSLFEEAKKQLIEKGEDDSRLLLGIAVSYDLIRDKRKLSALLDQLILYPDSDAIYIRPELIKSDTSPCEDPDYLKGLMCLVNSLTITKSVLLSRVDQSSLGLFANTKLSIAINPDPSIRKQDIKDKLSKAPRSGGPAKENIKTKYYIPSLFNDIELNRELKTEEFQKSIGKEVLCDCQYCKNDQTGVDAREYNQKRNLHFISSFWGQLEELKNLPVKDRKASIEKMLSNANRLYNKLSHDGIILSGESDGSFVKVWDLVFVKSE